MRGKDRGRKPRRKWLRRVIRLLVLLIVLGAAGLYAWFSLKAEYTVTYDSYTATRAASPTR